ncbi:MAG: AmmeMemoRadiSam system protein B [Desulfomonilaceae bacterium]|nr:AmmeMemoRadiSam system protein B [Desulfomonilaceae bacterium]
MSRVFTFGAAAVVVLTISLFLVLKDGFGVDSAKTSKGENVRRPAVAGMFYPARASALQATVSESLKSASKEQFPLPVKALLAPHAGYVYCGRTMAAAFKQIEGDAFRYDRVVMIGPSHRVRTKAAAVSSADVWETPLGPVSVDSAAAGNLVEKNDRIEFDDRAHANEHALEVQLPYLMVASGGKHFKIVPILTNSGDPGDQKIVADALAELAADPNTLVVVSSDLSHYPSIETAEKVDREILGAVTSLDPKTLIDADRKLMGAGHSGLDCTMCGLEATLCLVRAASRLRITNAETVSYTNSGMTAGDAGRVVGYGAVVFSGQGPVSSETRSIPVKMDLTAESKRELVAIARSAVAAAVNGASLPEEPVENPNLQMKAGCFVTLTNNGLLRGCIGCFTSETPLWKTVRDIATSSATRDPRFVTDPIVPSEVPELDIEVSVLSPMERVSRPLEQIALGRDGILVRDKGRSGTFLPQVAGETGWTVEEFLGHCSRDKAGLGWDGWRSPTAEVFTYTATIIAEKKLTESASEK